ncbi:substrate-binding domain-containing protein [Nonomuraea sp. KM88]|uniref:substrate-binding domain-containing protein n=1 Tax=Nonomuraea sp. KM88 TaxID=3457427 RepID=UPI003FCEB642
MPHDAARAEPRPSGRGARQSTPSLTSVSPDVESMAAHAVAMLHEQITGKPGGRASHIMVDFHLKCASPVSEGPARPGVPSRTPR